jgi:hypothetical protein
MKENHENFVGREVYILSDTDYELVITLYAKGRLMDYVLKKAKKALAKKKGLEVNTDKIKEIDEFDIEKSYFGVVKTFLSKRVNRQGSILQICNKEMRDAGKVCLSSYVTGGKFIREGDKWKIKVVLGGLYSNSI